MEILEAYTFALRAVFLLALAFGVVGMISGLFIRNYQLRTGFKVAEISETRLYSGGVEK